MFKVGVLYAVVLHLTFQEGSLSWKLERVIQYRLAKSFCGVLCLRMFHIILVLRCVTHLPVGIESLPADDDIDEGLMNGPAVVRRDDPNFALPPPIVESWSDEE